MKQSLFVLVPLLVATIVDGCGSTSSTLGSGGASGSRGGTSGGLSGTNGHGLTGGGGGAEGGHSPGEGGNSGDAGIGGTGQTSGPGGQFGTAAGTDGNTAAELDASIDARRVGAPDGEVSCDELADQYQQTLVGAQSCDLGSTSGQCGDLVPSAIGCPSPCMIHVNQAAGLDAIQTDWERNGCQNATGTHCPTLACSQTSSSICVAADGGGGTCSY